jgi:peroxiredoxin
MNTPPSRPLSEQLAEFRAQAASRSSPERRATMEGATAELKASGIEADALRVGDPAPAIALPDAVGRSTELAALWRAGPVVVVFYRGGWCPYCNLALRAWQAQLPELQRLGASLVAISPQTPDGSMSTAEKPALAFPVLSDSALEAAQAFRIAFEMPPALVELYRAAGNDLAVINGNGRWVLPLPATYVIDRDGVIAYAHIEADYRERAEPEQVLAAVAAVAG